MPRPCLPRIAPASWVSRVDIDRDGPTFTVDTLRDLHAAYDPADLFFIVGADALASVDTWREPATVRELAHIVGFPGRITDARRPRR